jgi:hypothetical protein
MVPFDWLRGFGFAHPPSAAVAQGDKMEEWKMGPYDFAQGDKIGK